MRTRRLCCIDLRRHLCSDGQKITSTCIDCKHPCPAGQEYAERFLGAGHRASTESVGNKVAILAKAYVKNKEQGGTQVSRVLHMVNGIGITTTEELKKAWSLHRAAMIRYADAHGLSEYFTARGRLSPSARAAVYAKRIKDYDGWLAEGYTWQQIATEKEHVSLSAVLMRYKAAKTFLEQWEEENAE